MISRVHARSPRAVQGWGEFARLEGTTRIGAFLKACWAAQFLRGATLNMVGVVVVMDLKRYSAPALFAVDEQLPILCQGGLPLITGFMEARRI